MYIRLKECVLSNTMKENKLHIAVLAGGCFWCTEAVFQRVEGVHKVISGYTGGTIKNPAYREITTGRTGHAEAIKVEYDPSLLTYQEILNIFFTTHDPTTLNRQGADKGTQYRSAIFYVNEEQKTIAENTINTLNEQAFFEDPIVTEVTEFDVLYKAEEYHQNYYNQNRDQGYCQFVINPKLSKLRNSFSHKLKKEIQN